MKSGSVLSVCLERRASMWPRSWALTPQFSSSHPVCLSIGEFNTLAPELELLQTFKAEFLLYFYQSLKNNSIYNDL